MKQVMKMLCLLFATAMCLRSDTTSSSTNPVARTENSSVNSVACVASGQRPKSWEIQNWTFSASHAPIRVSAAMNALRRELTEYPTPSTETAG